MIHQSINGLIKYIIKAIELENAKFKFIQQFISQNITSNNINLKKVNNKNKTNFTMSKRRDRHRSLSSVLSKADSKYLQKAKPIFGAHTAKSFFIPDQSRTISKNHTLDLTDFKKQRLFNRNISFFRQNFNQNDTSQLPFMSSLRQHQIIERNLEITTQSRPFTVSMKRTFNQHCSKRIFDSTAKQSRVSTAYYRWHNKSGKNNSTCVDFECTLRDYNMNKNPQQNGFTNTIKPIKYKDIEPKLYNEQQIICPKQKRLFRMK